MMNSSGIPVQTLLEAEQIPSDQMVVLYDDLDTDVGQLRIRRKGGAGGQNGVKSILSQGISDFLRIRLGISRPPRSLGNFAVVAHVLGQFSLEEQALTASSLAIAAFAVSDMADGVSPDNVMNRWNCKISTDTSTKTDK
eukprot:TRINITY_DN34826_c0_g1_i1.p2 TRINITY_DN34826_c0_g1~~TRINITY_DN34826_c0_g1_i1.p2  ORF type:complete len:139 (+),score=22.68 TRINITY_DN34826_c0_g1_i1:670-1086(+)